MAIFHCYVSSPEGKYHVPWPPMAEVTGTADRQGFLRNANSGRFASLATERSECTGTARWGDLVEGNGSNEHKTES